MIQAGVYIKETNTITLNLLVVEPSRQIYVYACTRVPTYTTTRVYITSAEINFRPRLL